MKNQLDELDEHFATLIKEKDREKFFRAVCEYLLYISDTSPLNSIARGALSGGMERLYKALQKAAKEVGNPTDKIWGDVVRQATGKASAYEAPASFWDTDTLRPFVRAFHWRMVEGAFANGLTRKRTIVFHTTDTSICMLGDEAKCYSIRGGNPQRFKIILILLRTQTGKSAREIARLLYKPSEKKSVQDNLKEEIADINKIFKNNLDVEDELIVRIVQSGKNIYSLNRERFYFRKEK